MIKWKKNKDGSLVSECGRFTIFREEVALNVKMWKIIDSTSAEAGSALTLTYAKRWAETKLEWSKK